jgi:maltose O-acetyltransferase
MIKLNMINYVRKHKSLKCIALIILKITLIMRLIIEAIIRNIPWQLGGSRIRKYYYGIFFKSLGEGGRIDEGIIIYGASRIECGSGVVLGRNLIIQASGGLKLGNDILIGPGCFIWSINHDYTVENMCRESKYIFKKVIIEDQVWIAANVKIVPGVRIGTGSVIAMGSVVTKDVPPHCIAAGNPARVIKYIK